MSSEKKFKEAEEKLIGTAVFFLSNPNVEKESDELKRAFLKKKGLNEEMIKEAYHRYEVKKAEQEKKDSATENASTAKKIDINALIERSQRTKFLSLRGTDVTQIGSELISKIGHVEQLILNGNQIASIDSSINSLKKLRILHMSNCNLDSGALPPEFYELEGLEDLNLSNNHFHEIGNLVKLPNLQRLDLSKNDVVSIDAKALNDNRSLTVLNLKDNNVTAVPDGIRKSLVVIV